MVDVRTSDGFLTEFDSAKIIDSILRETSLDANTAKKIATSVSKKTISLPELSGALIRGLVLDYMIRHGLNDAYNEYRRVGVPMAEIKRIWSVEGDTTCENANIDASNPEGIHKHVADLISKEAVLLMLPPEIRDLHISGSLHIHDLEYFLTRFFCFDSDMRYIFKYGLLPDGNGSHMPVASPAKSAEVAVLHAAKTLGCMQCMCAGGQGFQNFLTFLSPYLFEKSYEEIKQLMQMFIYEMSQMMVARGGQAVFSSVQLTPGVPKIWRDKPIVYRGKVWNGIEEQKITYGMFEPEVRKGFSAFMDILRDGDAWGKPFSFPKPEVVISEDFLGKDDSNLPGVPSYNDLYLKCFDVIARNGSIYLENQLHTKKDVISCVQYCAYRFEKSIDDTDFQDQLNFKDGKHFSLGSYQVVTLNLPRAAYIGHDLPGTIQELKKLVDWSIEIFKIKKSAISKQPLPFARQTPNGAPPFADIDGLSFVIGVVGLNEAVQHLTGNQMHESTDAWKTGIRIMTELEIYVKSRRADTGMMLALARTPAETTAQRFAVADLLDPWFSESAKKVVKGNLGAALENISKTRDLPVEYSNGTHLAVGAILRLEKRIELEHVFFPIVDGGNIFHIFLDDMSPFYNQDGLVCDGPGKYRHVPPWESNPKAWMGLVVELKDRIIDIMRSSRLGYIKISKDTTVCNACHTVFSGLYDRCKRCGSENVDRLALITGYVGNLKSFNAAKKQEVMDRYRYGFNELRKG